MFEDIAIVSALHVSLYILLLLCHRVERGLYFETYVAAIRVADVVRRSSQTGQYGKCLLVASQDVVLGHSRGIGWFLVRCEETHFAFGQEKPDAS